MLSWCMLLKAKLGIGWENILDLETMGKQYLVHYNIASTNLLSKKIHAPIWSLVALKGNYMFDQNKT